MVHHGDAHLMARLLASFERGRDRCHGERARQHLLRRQALGHSTRRHGRSGDGKSKNVTHEAALPSARPSPSGGGPSDGKGQGTRLTRS
jgi:hypothetical protein